MSGPVQPRALSYSAACAQAATDQGLDPIVDSLTGAGVPCGVWQMGGFCMAVGVQGEDPSRYCLVTSWQDYAGEPDTPGQPMRCLVGYYPDPDTSDAAGMWERVPLDIVPDLLRTVMP